MAYLLTGYHYDKSKYREKVWPPTSAANMPQVSTRLLVVNFLPVLWHQWCTLKGICHEIFSFKFFSCISFSGPLSIPWGPFRIFSKIRGDFREWMFISDVNDTCDKREKFWGINCLHIFFELCWVYFTHLDFIFVYFIFRCRQADIGTIVVWPV